MIVFSRLVFHGLPPLERLKFSSEIENNAPVVRNYQGRD